jgi:hypothetical protein
VCSDGGRDDNGNSVVLSGAVVAREASALNSSLARTLVLVSRESF